MAKANYPHFATDLTEQSKLLIMEKQEKTPHLVLMKNGPLKISGSFTLTNDKNEEIKTGDELYLCRCGNSKNSPFCDSTHKSSDSSSDESPKNCD